MLKMYTADMGDPSEYAVLVFAKTARQAKAVAWKMSSISVLGGSDQFTDLRVRFLRDAEFLYAEADPRALSESRPHVVEPRICGRCERWGFPIDDEGICEACRDLDS